MSPDQLVCMSNSMIRLIAQWRLSFPPRLLRSKPIERLLTTMININFIGRFDHFLIHDAVMQ